MREFTGYMRGMGLGGWLTNYKRIGQLPVDKRLDLTVGDLEHFDSYITEADVRNLASFGIDHVRLGFDQLALEDNDNPYHYREEVFRHIDDFLCWAAKYRLNVILNLHKAIGCYCDCPSMKPLLDTPEYQDRFIALWLEFERRYHDKGDEIVFELMNEVTGGDALKWNNLYKRAITELRRVNPTRYIMVGSAEWNSVNRLRDLDVLDDERVVYTFHFYAPFEFTHQRGVLQPMNHYYNREMPYPCEVGRYRDCQEFLYGRKRAYADYEEIGRKFIRDQLAPAKEFIDAHPDAILTCGEFGTIRSCPTIWRENWFADVIEFLDDNSIPFTIWNYLSTPYDGNRFSLVDDDFRRPVSEKIIGMLRR